MTYHYRIERRTGDTWEPIEGSRHIAHSPLPDGRAAKLVDATREQYGCNCRLVCEVMGSSVVATTARPPEPILPAAAPDLQAMAAQLLKLHLQADTLHTRLCNLRIDAPSLDCWGKYGPTINGLAEASVGFLSAASNLERWADLTAEAERLLATPDHQ